MNLAKRDVTSDIICHKLEGPQACKNIQWTGKHMKTWYAKCKAGGDRFCPLVVNVLPLTLKTTKCLAFPPLIIRRRGFDLGQWSWDEGNMECWTLKGNLRGLGDSYTGGSSLFQHHLSGKNPSRPEWGLPERGTLKRCLQSHCYLRP